jgi:hypothetical protein
MGIAFLKMEFHYSTLLNHVFAIHFLEMKYAHVMVAGGVIFILLQVDVELVTVHCNIAWHCLVISQYS